MDVLASVSTELIVTHPLSIDIWDKLCQNTQAQVPGGCVVNGYCLPSKSLARQAVCTEEVEEPMACIRMILEAVMDNKYRTVALPCMCIA